MSSRILCVDQSANGCHNCKRLLSQHYKIETIIDASFTLETFRQKVPELLICDVEILKLGQFRLLKELRADPQTKELPILIVSTPDKEEYCVEGLEAGADDYLLKPFSDRELLSRVKVNLKKVRMRQEAASWQQMLLGEIEKELRQISLTQHSEEELQLNEHQFRAFFNGALDAMVITNDDGRYVDANPAACELFGLSKIDLLGHTIADFSEAHINFNETWSSFKAKGKMTGEFPILRPDGTLRKVEFAATANFLPYLHLSVLRDITERKKVEKMLWHQAQIIAQMNDSVISTDLNGYIASWNKGSEKLLGYSVEEALGQHVSLFYTEPMRSAFQNQVIAPLLEKGEHETEVIVQHKSGKLIDISLSLSLLRDRDGTPVGMLGYSKDITERKKTEKKVREQSALIDVATDAICVRSLSNEILFWNRSAEKLYGWTAEEVLGKKATELFCRQVLPQQIEEALKSVVEQEHWESELQQVTKDGKKILVLSRWTLLRDEVGQIKSILTVNTDITQKKQLEAQLCQAQRLESIGTLASGISHDFNNILTPILAVSQLLPLKLPHLDEQTRQLLEIVENNSKRGADLANQILSFARGVEGKLVPIQIKYLLKEIERIVKSVFPKSIEISIDIPKGNFWLMVGDSTQIHQVLMNLCINAKDAMPDGGTLKISAWNFFADESYVKMNLNARTGPYIAIAIKDTGTGIPEEIRERIFEPFFTTKEPGIGTGLGLFSVINIVNNHRGFICVNSEVGKGTEFQIYLPAVWETVIQENSDSDLPEGNGELILVVDDEANILETTKTILEKYNYKTLIANDAIEGLSLFAQYKNQIRAVLIDMQMPSMDGLKVIPILQKIDPQVQIIGMSGVGSNRKALEAFGNSIKFLLKPYTIKELLDTTQSVLVKNKIQAS